MSFYPFSEWTAGTAYLVGAVVTPITPDGTCWRATVAGTSAGTEPTWPTAVPWSVVDGGVTWTRGTTFRQDVNNGLQTVLLGFQSANPTLLRKIYTERPGNVGSEELPAAWIDAQPESIKHDMGTRTRTQAPTVVVVDRTPAPEEFSDRINFLVDALIDAFTAYPHAASGTSIVQMTGVTEVDIDEGGVHVSGVSLAFGEVYVTEGRN